MKPNVGNIDRFARVVLGLALLGFAMRLGFPNTGWNWAGWSGVIPLVTAVFRYCPAYHLFGTGTAR